MNALAKYWQMKDKTLNIRMSQKRLDRLRLYSVQREKTMTNIIEDFIDGLPVKEIGNNSTISLPNQPDG